jgi:cation:H+ antiporter
MVAVAIACLPIFVTGREIARWEGGLFFAYYLAYTSYVVMAAMQHAALDLYGTAMLWFVLPLTGVTLAVLFARDRLDSRSNDDRRT